MPRFRSSDRFDLVVLGGGTGGIVASLIAARAGARVALVERDRIGGDCLWTGCVPSKSLLAAADLAHRIRHADAVGLAPADPEVDFGTVMDHVERAIRRIEPQDSPERLRREGVDVIEAEGRFDGPGTLTADGRRLCFRRAIVATGSRPLLPPVDGLSAADPLTTDSVWELRELPERLVVLGGGPIGCELGQAFARLGSRVTLVELADRLLLKEEPRASRLIAERLRDDGVDVRVQQRAVRAEPGNLIIEDAAGGNDAIAFDRILVSTGRAPRTDGIGLERAGVRVDERGAVMVSPMLRTTSPSVYAVGDVTGLLPFTHVAAHHARVATPNALFRLRRTVDSTLPWVTFTDPEVARIGLTETEARQRWGERVTVSTAEYSELDRAITAGQDYGFATLVGDPRGRLVGATVAAPAAGEAIAELTAWLARGAKVDDVSATVHAYPTLAEGPARAADTHVIARYARPHVRALKRLALALQRGLGG
jgi:pyruvate/2-oxoglutarate dehydrogenase complex dihydrolipoamide dehydrogenase (E3) component